MDDLVEIETGIGIGSQVRLDAVVPHIWPRVFEVASRADEPLEVVETPDDLWAPVASPALDASIRWHSSVTVGIAAMVSATLAAVGASIVEHDIAAGFFVAAVVVVAAFARNASRRATLTFGEGFLGYRSDMGWPRGVQEDDEVPWSWRTSPQTPADRLCAMARR